MDFLIIYQYYHYISMYVYVSMECNEMDKSFCKKIYRYTLTNILDYTLIVFNVKIILRTTIY